MRRIENIVRAGSTPATEDRLKTFSDELVRWRRTTNLISQRDYSGLWQRHIEDSLQILALAPDAKRWLDIGTGSGFPGLAIAIQLHDVTGAEIHCVESDKRKCAFLVHVARKTGAPAIIHPARIEEIDSRSLLPIQAVTSRAVTSLPTLLKMSKDYLDNGAVGIFPVGRRYDAAVAFMRAQPQYMVKFVQSVTDPDSRLVWVQNRPEPLS